MMLAQLLARLIARLLAAISCRRDPKKFSSADGDDAFDVPGEFRRRSHPRHH